MITTPVFWGGVPTTAILAQSGNQLQSDITVAGLSGGGYVVIWQIEGSSTLGGYLHDAFGAVNGGLLTFALPGLDPSSERPVKPAATGLADGGFVLTWNDLSGGIQAQRFSAQGAALDASPVVLDSTNFSAPTVVALNDGGYLVAWTESGNWVKARRVDPAGNPTGNDIIPVPLVDSSKNPKLAASTTGDFAIAYTTLASEARLQLYSSDGTAQGSVISLPGFEVFSISAYSGGFVAAVRTASGVEVQSVDDFGNLIGGSVLVTANARTGGPGDDPEIIRQDDGGYVVTWVHADNPNGSPSGDVDVRGQRFDNTGTKVGVEFLVHAGSPGNPNDQVDQTSAILSDGRFVTAYVERTGGAPNSVDTVFTQILDARGEIVLGTDQADTLLGRPIATSIFGTAGNDFIVGQGGDDILDGGADNDFIWGQAGDDMMTGGTGDDVFVVEDAGDVVVELPGEGTDTVYAHVNHTLAANVEIGALLGTTAVSMTGNGLSNVLIGNAIGNTLDGGGGDDALYANAGANTLLGSDGNDTLVTGTGNDILAGGAGDDAYIVDALDSVIEYAGAGVDSVYSRGGIYFLPDHVENGILSGGSSLVGNTLNNTLIGDAGFNILFGVSGSNFMVAGAGNDTLISGTGLDTMQGGTGGDVFWWSNTAMLGDIIQDWIDTEDQLQFSATPFLQTVGGSLVEGLNFVAGTAPAAATANATFLWDTDDTNLYFDADGTGVRAAELVADFQAFTTVGVGDFQFV